MVTGRKQGVSGEAPNNFLEPRSIALREVLFVKIESLRFDYEDDYDD